LTTQIIKNNSALLDVFPKFMKAAISFLMSVCASVRIKKRSTY